MCVREREIDRERMKSCETEYSPCAVVDFFTQNKIVCNFFGKVYVKFFSVLKQQRKKINSIGELN